MDDLGAKDAMLAFTAFDVAVGTKGANGHLSWQGSAEKGPIVVETGVEHCHFEAAAELPRLVPAVDAEPGENLVAVFFR